MKWLIVIIVLNVSVHSRELSLAAAQHFLIQNNYDLQMAQEEITRSSIEIKSAKASLYPSIDFSGSFNYLSELSKVKTTIPKLGTFVSDAGQHDRTELGTDISYPLFTGMARINTIKSKQLAVENNRYNKAIIKNRYSFILGITYLRWCLAVEQMEVRQNNIDLMKNYVSQMTVLRNGGIVVDTKVLEGDAKLKAAELEFILAKDLADSLKTELLGMAGIQDSSFVPQKSFAYIDSLKIPDSITMTRTEIQLYDNRLHLIDLSSRIVKSQRYPVVAAVAGYRIANPGLNQGMDEFMDYFILGAQLKWNIFDGFRNRNDRAALEKQKNITDLEKEKMIDAWKRSLLLWNNQVSSADEKIKAAEIAHAAYEAYVVSIENSLKAGVVTNLDFETAVTNLTLADLQVEQAKFNKRIAILNVIFVSGQDINFNEN
jgi:outer membrane protein